MQHAAAQTLLRRVIDYAGLFPPAALAMPAALAEYDGAQQGADAWLLGRFVAPASRLAELAHGRLESGARYPLTVSAIVTDGSEADRVGVTAFNARAAQHGAVVDSVEGRPATLDGVAWLAEHYGGPFEVYVEVPFAEDAAAWFERVAAFGLRGKLRTGGVTADAFPDPAALARRLQIAVASGVPFKATAGLHHAVRGDYPLTYQPAAERAPMYGYLNLLLATAALRAGADVARATELLTSSDTASLTFDDTGGRWGDFAFTTELLHDVRERALVSFGSCSFGEPAAEYHALASIEARH